MMGRRFGALMLALVVAAAVWRPAPVGADDGRRVALVIGNGQYEHITELPNPPADARDMGQALRDIGFEVVEAIDADYLGMQDAFRQFGAEIEGADIALVFFAGHGLQVAGENYLLPTSAEVEQERDLRYEAFPLSMVTTEIELGQPRTSLIILDACRDNPITRTLTRRAEQLGRSAAVGRGLAPTRGTSGMLIAYATAPGDVALDGEGDNSPFTTALLQHITEPGLEVGLLFRRVRESVIAATRGQQVPWVEEALIGELYLTPPEAVANPDQEILARFDAAMALPTPEEQAAALAAFIADHPDHRLAAVAERRLQSMTAAGPSEVDRAEQETVVWQSTQRIEMPEQAIAALQYYLTTYPNGAYVALAELQISGLEARLAREAAEAEPADPQDQASAIEVAFWNAIADSDDPSEFLAYLDRFPDGAFAVLAENALAELEVQVAAAPTERGGDTEIEVAVATPPDAPALIQPFPLHSVIGVGPVPIDLGAVPGPIRVDSLPDNGVVAADGSPVAAGDTLLPAQARALTFEPGDSAMDSESALAYRLADRPETDAVSLTLTVDVHECDRLAGARLDTQGVVPGNIVNEIRVAQAVDACQSAMNVYPDVPRFVFQLGRALDAGGEFAEAAGWYRQAAEDGYLLAINNLGYLYQYGRGVPVNHEEAFRLFQEAADGGDAYAFNNLGKLYQQGQGVPRNYSEAVTWFRRAAAAGHTFGFNNLGWMYQNGYGVPRDYEEALRQYRQAADAGDIFGYNNVGVMYANGLGVAQDYAEAARWYRMAAEEGQSLAQNNLGLLYQNGQGVDQDLAEAARWYEAAALQGHAWAQNNLGWLYHTGGGVPRDFARAARWYVRAMVHRNRDASRAAAENLATLPNAALITLAQQLLVEQGYDPGEVDGMTGEVTRSAIRAYQSDVGLTPADGQVTIDLLMDLVERS